MASLVRRTARRLMTGKRGEDESAAPLPYQKYVDEPSKQAIKDAYSS
eukprot:gene616-20103_t